MAKDAHLRSRGPPNSSARAGPLARAPYLALISLAFEDCRCQYRTIARDRACPSLGQPAAKASQGDNGDAKSSFADTCHEYVRQESHPISLAQPRAPRAKTSSPRRPVTESPFGSRRGASGGGISSASAKAHRSAPGMPRANTRARSIPSFEPKYSMMSRRKESSSTWSAALAGRCRGIQPTRSWLGRSSRRAGSSERAGAWASSTVFERLDEPIDSRAGGYGVCPRSGSGSGAERSRWRAPWAAARGHCCMQGQDGWRRLRVRRPSRSRFRHLSQGANR